MRFGCVSQSDKALLKRSNTPKYFRIIPCTNLVAQLAKARHETICEVKFMHEIDFNCLVSQTQMFNFGFIILYERLLWLCERLFLAFEWFIFRVEWKLNFETRICTFVQ